MNENECENCEFLNLRPEVRHFAKHMEMVLKQHDAKKGDSWKNEDEWALRDSLWREIKEWQNEVENQRVLRHRDVQEEAAELLDVANFIFMLYIRLNPLPPDWKIKGASP